MSKKRKTVIQHAEAIANRDGGWNCHYCKIELIRNWSEVPQEFGGHDRDGNEVWGIPKGTSNRVYMVDHVIPVARGGSDELSNLVLACRLCNSRKGTKSHDEYMAILRGEQ